MAAHDLDLPICGQMRVRGYRRVSHGLFLAVREGLDDDRERRRDLRAWLAVLPPGAVFTHLTGAWLRGWALPSLPEQVPVFAAVRATARRPRRAGLVCSRLVDPPPDDSADVGGAPRPVERRHGLPVERPEEILLRAARDLGLLDLTVLLESALHRRDLDPDALRRLLESRRPGVRALRVAWSRASARAESAGESLLRLFHDAMDVPCKPQAEIHDQDGALLGVADLLVVGTHFVHEYDGAHHRRGRQHGTDLRRERGLASAGYVRRGFTLDDLLNHANVVMHELDRALGREHDLRRMTRWRALAEQSLYSEAGRRRLMNRWSREMGVRQWARSA